MDCFLKKYHWINEFFASDWTCLEVLVWMDPGNHVPCATQAAFVWFGEHNLFFYTMSINWNINRDIFPPLYILGSNHSPYIMSVVSFWSLQDRTLFHPVSNSCMDCNPAEKKIFMARCDPLSETQQWIFDHINMTVLEKFNHHASS